MSGYGSVRNPDHELQVRELIRGLSGLPIVCGHELSSRLNYVARANTAILNARLLSVIRQLLENPKLTEDDVVRLATRRPAQAATLRELANSPKWLCRGRVRMSILLNPGASPALTYPLLGVCSRTELREVTRSTHVSPELRQVAAEYLELGRRG